MTKQSIISVFREAFESKEDILHTVFGQSGMPEDIGDVALNLSSLEFVDLIIVVEELLGLESVPESIMTQGITIGELAERISNNVQ